MHVLRFEKQTIGQMNELENISQPRGPLQLKTRRRMLIVWIGKRMWWEELSNSHQFNVRWKWDEKSQRMKSVWTRSFKLVRRRQMRRWFFKDFNSYFEAKLQWKKEEYQKCTIIYNRYDVRHFCSSIVYKWFVYKDSEKSLSTVILNPLLYLRKSELLLYI